MGGAWAVPLRNGLCDIDGGKLMRPKAETRSVLRRAVSSTRTRKVSSVWCVPSDQQEGPKAETRGVCSEEQCRPHVVGRCRPCGTCPATNRRGPCHLTVVVVAVVGGRALPPLRSHPRRNRSCGLDGNQKQNHYEIKHRKDWRNAATLASQAFDDAICASIILLLRWEVAVELESISDSSQWNWGFHTVVGGVDPRELGFLPPFVFFLDIWNEPWTGDGTLSSPGGPGSITYEPQPIRDRPVGGIGDFHTVRGGINPGDMVI